VQEFRSEKVIRTARTLITAIQHGSTGFLPKDYTWYTKTAAAEIASVRLKDDRFLINLRSLLLVDANALQLRGEEKCLLQTQLKKLHLL
jgi:hypothetical protein